MRASLGLSTFLTVRVLPSGSRTFAAIRRTSLRFRLRTVRSFFVSFMRTVTRRPAATEKRFALSLSFSVVWRAIGQASTRRVAVAFQVAAT